MTVYSAVKDGILREIKVYNDKYLLFPGPFLIKVTANQREQIQNYKYDFLLVYICTSLHYGGKHSIFPNFRDSK